jgi:hypothetical protein
LATWQQNGNARTAYKFNTAPSLRPWRDERGGGRDGANVSGREAYHRRMGIVAKIRRLLTGEPEDAEEKLIWQAEKARIREEKTAAKLAASSDIPGWKPPK